MIFKGTIIIRREEEWFVATCIENNIASQGKTIDEATENLKEAIALYYEDELEEKVRKSCKIYKRKPDCNYSNTRHCCSRDIEKHFVSSKH
jgi:predicted RNase H-like HicB family nuclease